MIASVLLLQAGQPTVPDTYHWTLAGTAIIVGISLLCLLIIPRSIRYPHVGNKMPLPFPAVFNNPSIGSFLAAMSAGHAIGIPVVLGLNNLGILK